MESVRTVIPVPSRVGSRKNSPMDMARPSSTASVVIRAVNRSPPSLSLSHFSNLEGSSSSSPSSG